MSSIDIELTNLDGACQWFAGIVRELLNASSKTRNAQRAEAHEMIENARPALRRSAAGDGVI